MPRDNFTARIFGSLQENGAITVDETESNYVRVLKLNSGDEIELFLQDGIYHAKFNRLSKNNFSFYELEKIEVQQNFDFNIDLLFGLCSKENVRDVLDFGTQAGVNNFYPTAFDFSAGKKSEPFLEKKGEIIIREAVRQSKRIDMPKLHAITKDVSKFKQDYHSVIIADLNQNREELVKPPLNESILVVIGPESGLSENDLQKLKERFTNTKVLTVSPIVMRTQIAVVGVINYIRGAFR